LLSKNLKLKIYRTIILPVVLYVCETWSVTLREKRRLRVSESRVLMGIFVPKRDEVTGEWRKVHNEELNVLLPAQYCASDKTKKNEMGWAFSAYGGGVYRVLIAKPEGRRPLGRPRRRWKDNIKMEL